MSSKNFLFAGRYRVISCIGRGGMGAVHEVEHVETGRRRALKLMLPNVLQSEDMRDRFRREARITAHIESEHLVDVLDAGIDEATQAPFLVMELLRGEELSERLARLGRFDPWDVVTYLRHVAIALEKTHRASIVHRDLKPGNLFLTKREDGSPLIKILDFGVAKLMVEGSTIPATRPLGTPLYMAPEQLHLDQKISKAVDIYALGMIAYTLLVGVPYWHEVADCGNLYELVAILMQGPREPATARAARQGVALPPLFDEWFAKATSVSPEARFPSALSAVQALETIIKADVGPHRTAIIPSTIAADLEEGRDRGSSRYSQEDRAQPQVTRTLLIPEFAASAQKLALSERTSVLPYSDGPSPKRRAEAAMIQEAGTATGSSEARLNSGKAGQRTWAFAVAVLGAAALLASVGAVTAYGVLNREVVPSRLAATALRSAGAVFALEPVIAQAQNSSAAASQPNGQAKPSVSRSELSSISAPSARPLKRYAQKPQEAPPPVKRTDLTRD